MKNSKYIIPKGYKGINKEIILEFNTNLAVITGLNGSGKSTILKYLYENYPDRSKCFAKIPQQSSVFNDDRRYSSRIYYNKLGQKEDISFEELPLQIKQISILHYLIKIRCTMKKVMRI